MQMRVSGKRVQGSRSSECKGPGACLRTRKEASVAAGEQVRQSAGGNEDREAVGLRVVGQITLGLAARVRTLGLPQWHVSHGKLLREQGGRAVPH